MKPIKKVKTIADKLTTRQKYALLQAKRGDYHYLYQVCRETMKALDTIKWVNIKGATTWNRKTTEHYTELLRYLESFIDNEQANLDYLEFLSSYNKRIQL